MPENGPAATSFSPSASCKMGAMRKRCGGFTKWSVRYIVLDKNQRVLHYYHTPKDQNPKRTIDLKNQNIRLAKGEPPETENNPGFKITLVGERDFIFIGTNPAVIDDWIKAIAQTISPEKIPANTNLPPNGLQGTMGSLARMAAPNPAPSGAPQGGDNFNYNGPTISVVPNRRPLNSQAMPPDMGMPPQRPDQATLVGHADADGSSTLVHGNNAGAAKRTAGSAPVPVLVLVPDNKRFPTMEHVINGIVKIGRYMGSNAPTGEDMFTFKSKVISRHHAEVWSVGTDIYLRDTRSQSGTFLNAMRLSEPGKESKPYKLKTGDIIQFGVDYKGATDDNSRCITVRVEIRVVTMTPDGQIMPMREDTMGGETLVAANANDGNATLVGGSGNDQTLVSRKEQTLVNQQQPQGDPNYITNGAGPFPPKRDASNNGIPGNTQAGGAGMYRPRMGPPPAVGSNPNITGAGNSYPNGFTPNTMPYNPNGGVRPMMRPPMRS